MLKNWFAPLLGARAYYSEVKLLVILGCSALSVSKLDQETIFDQPDCGRILFFKMILSDFEPLMKIVFLDM
jgi:hypothetical protein